MVEGGFELGTMLRGWWCRGNPGLGAAGEKSRTKNLRHLCLLLSVEASCKCASFSVFPWMH